MDIMELFYRHRDDVYRLAVSYTHSPQEAEDVCQSVFLKLLEQKNITPGKEQAWLMQVTANACRSLLRSHWWKHTVPLNESIPAPAMDDGGTLRAVMALPPKYRVVIYLYYYEEYSTKEIAQLLKISQTAVTSRLNRGREQLRRALQED